MCGIVGLFLKDRSLEPDLGAMLTDMLVTMSDRGPDSAGIAVYRDGARGDVKITLQSADPERDFEDLGVALSRPVEVIDTHAIVRVPASEVADMLARIARDHPGLRLEDCARVLRVSPDGSVSSYSPSPIDPQ